MLNADELRRRHFLERTVYWPRQRRGAGSGSAPELLVPARNRIEQRLSAESEVPQRVVFVVSLGESGYLALPQTIVLDEALHELLAFHQLPIVIRNGSVLTPPSIGREMLCIVEASLEHGQAFA